MTLIHLVSPVRLTAAEPPEEEPAGSSRASSSPRTIEGRLLAYDTEARLGDGMTYRFRAGSLRARRDTTPVLLGHDPQRPAGVLRELREEAGGPVAVISIDQTADGDMALAQAASGSRSGLSLGAEPITFSLNDQGVVDVELAELHELSLVSIPAFEAALVSSVTAHRGAAPMQAVAAQSPAPDPIPEPEPTPQPAPPPPPQQPEPLRAQLIVRSEAGAPLVMGASSRPVITIDQYVGAMVRAARGDVGAARILEAAALVPSFVADNPGVLPPAYTTEILGGLPDVRPLYSICAVRAMPASGMQIRKPIWTTKPDGGWMTDDTVPAATNTPKVGLHDVAVHQWAYAFATSQAVAERSSPDYIEAVYRQALLDYHRDCEAQIAALIVADASAAAGTIGAGVGGVYTATGRTADVLLCSPDMFGALLDEQGFQRFSSGTAAAGSGGVRGNIFGMDVVVSGSLPAGSMFVGVRGAIEFRETQPIRLSANVVGAMQIELGVTSFASWDLELPDAFAAANLPVLAPAGARAASK